MTYRDMDIVSAVRSLLVQRLGADRFELWIGATTGIEVVGNCVIVVAENNFKVECLRKGFSTEIKAAATEALGEPAKIEFRVDDSLFNRESTNVERTLEVAAESKAKTSTASRNSSEKSPRGPRRFAKLQQYAVGACNRFAFSSAQMVIQQPGEMSPFVVYGPSGNGKTHLLEGIWSHLRSSGRRRIVYLAAEQFTTYFLQALRGSGLPSFRQKYRALDTLIIDDIQFFEGKQATLTELLHTFDALTRDSRQLILSADRRISLLRLGDELAARLAGGLVCEIKSLDADTRLQILRSMAKERNMQIPDAVQHRIASAAPGDARQLSGALNRIWVTHLALNQPITPALADQVVAELFPATTSFVRLDDIQRAVCDEFGIDANLLRSDRRSKKISHPRMLAMWLARKHTRAALTEISEYFGRRSHSTVVSAQHKVQRWVDDGFQVQCSHLKRDVRDVLDRLEQNLKVS